MFALAFASGASGVLLGRYAARHAGWSLTGLLSPWDIAGVLAVWLAAVFVHEAGHWTGGRIGGMRLVLMTVGPLRLTRDPSGWRLGLFLRPGVFGGLTAMVPAGARPVAPQLQSMIAGGPLASLLLAGAGLGVLVAASGRIALYGGAVAVVSCFLFAITAIPLRIGGFLNDGAQWRELRRGSPAAQLRIVLAALSAQSLSGTRPRDLDGAALARAHALDDGSDALCSAGLHFFDYAIASDRGDPAGAAGALERIAARIDEIPQGLRQAYAIELAYFEAAHRGDAGRARTWIEQARGGLVEPAVRARATAAVALAEGRRDAALEALDEAERALRRHVDRGGAQLLADQLHALRERLADR
ncbi:MAG TPA: hypothetical protein VMR06_14610 [Dokdonella sp.]|uniref:hypothetical protein n=1 Tax=Dokdonella sp. TaxID=2291710 RepID=UPI002C5A5AC4|nr:hypothetical protein [Dokdonella sp.]HUD43220.1 hypothetical protein [Dokdonella sp.]